MKFILAKKQNMSQIFDDNGNVVPVTIVKAGPCPVSQVKNIEKDGYQSVQIAFEDKKKNTKQLQGHLKDIGSFRYMREFRVDSTENIERGKVITVDTFEVGDKVKVVGTSKGKGFAGVVKRHGFSGAPKTHGHKDQERMPGSIGCTGPARVFKGLRMGGHMGNERVSVKNLEIVKIDSTNNIFYIKGAIPGAKESLVMILAEGELKFQEKVVAEPKKEETVENTPAEKVEETKEEAKEEVKEDAPAEAEKTEEVKEEVEVKEEKVEETKEEEPKSEEKPEEAKPEEAKKEDK